MALLEYWPTVCQALSSLLIPGPAFENGASQAERSREKEKLALCPSPHTHSPEWCHPGHLYSHTESWAHICPH